MLEVPAAVYIWIVLIAPRQLAASTESLPVADRIAYWEHYHADAVVGLTCSTYDERGLLARASRMDIGGCLISEIAGNAHVIERSQRLVDTHPKDSTFISLLTEGDAFFYHPSGLLRMRPGDAVIYSADRPYLFGFGSNMRQLMVDLPREHLLSLTGLERIAEPTLIQSATGGLAATTAHLLRTLESIIARGEVPAAEVTATVQDAVASLIPGTDGAAAVATTAKQFIAQHLSDPELDIDSVAGAVGFSARHLNRIFALEQTTVSRYIHGQRLLLARVDLEDPTLNDRRISEIAYRWGFASQAHFATAFKRAFEYTPSECRALQGISASAATKPN